MQLYLRVNALSRSLKTSVKIKMKSNTKIEKQLKKKTNSLLVETIIAAKKNSAWKEVAEILSGSRRKQMNFNLTELNGSEKGTVVVAGKVLSQGDIDSKIKVVACSFSEKAKDKLKKAGCEVKTILEEIKSNPNAKDILVLRK